MFQIDYKIYNAADQNYLIKELPGKLTSITIYN